MRSADFETPHLCIKSRSFCICWNSSQTKRSLRKSRREDLQSPQRVRKRHLCLSCLGYLHRSSEEQMEKADGCSLLPSLPRACLLLAALPGSSLHPGNCLKTEPGGQRTHSLKPEISRRFLHLHRGPHLHVLQDENQEVGLTCHAIWGHYCKIFSQMHFFLKNGVLQAENPALLRHIAGHKALPVLFCWPFMVAGRAIAQVSASPRTLSIS